LLDTIPTPSISACDTHFIPFSYLFARFFSIFEKFYFLKKLIFFIFLYIYIKNKFLKIKNIYFFNLFSNEKQIKKTFILHCDCFYSYDFKKIFLIVALKN
jgi:hypothetical protein